MHLYRRVALVVANEGAVGALRRVVARLRRVLRVDRPQDVAALEPQDVAALKKEHANLVKIFHEKTQSLGYGDLSKYHWYHTVDLGNGLVTPGDRDYRSVLPLFQFPQDMAGMSVLDVGSATGFFAFEFEKRGAKVTSVDIPSIGHWDSPTPEDREQMIKDYLEYFQVDTIEKVQQLHLDGPFEFCRKLLSANLRRVHSTIYDLSLQRLASTGFDLVFVGDLLLHLISPLEALAVLAPLCTDTLIISQTLANPETPPMMLYVGGEARGGDSYWLPNLSCFERMLKRVGFDKTSVVGYHQGMNRQVWSPFDCAIIRATKRQGDTR